jgi:hypothetical protein
VTSSVTSKAGSSQRQQRTVFSPGTVTFVVDGELEGQISQGPGGAAEQVIASAGDALDLPLLPVTAIRAAPSIQVGEETAEEDPPLSLSKCAHRDALCQFRIGRQSAQVE